MKEDGSRPSEKCEEIQEERTDCSLFKRDSHAEDLVGGGGWTGNVPRAPGGPGTQREVLFHQTFFPLGQKVSSVFFFFPLEIYHFAFRGRPSLGTCRIDGGIMGVSGWCAATGPGLINRGWSQPVPKWEDREPHLNRSMEGTQWGRGSLKGNDIPNSSAICVNI